MRVFLDSNILLSASLRPSGNAGELVEFGRDGACDLLTTAYALEETLRNLRKKAPGALPRFHLLERMFQRVDEASTKLVQWATSQGLPLKDAPILAAAVAARADLLVTGDRRHFGVLFGRTLRGVTVLSLKDGLAAVLAAAERGR